MIIEWKTYCENIKFQADYYEKWSDKVQGLIKFWAWAWTDLINNFDDLKIFAFLLFYREYLTRTVLILKHHLVPRKVPENLNARIRPGQNDELYHITYIKWLGLRKNAIPVSLETNWATLVGWHLIWARRIRDQG